MDLQPERSGQPVGVPIATSIEGQSPCCHEDYHCYLEHLFLRKDFNYLANLLYATIWHRFDLLGDEHLRADISSENCAGQVRKNEQEVSLTKSLCHPSVDLLWDKENVAGVFSTHLFGTICETDQSTEIARSVGLTHRLDTVAESYLHRDNVYNVTSSNTIFSPWFVLSAVFAGCPKLLHHILSSCVERNICMDYSQNKQMSDDAGKETKLNEVASIQQDLIGASNISPFVGVDTSFNKNSKHLQPLHENVDHTIPTTTSYREKSSSYPQTVHQVVNAKMACEFPITDTWIHKSVNLMVSALHLACWRLDFCSISLLLQHGADPNELALEQVPDELIQRNDSSVVQENFFRLSDNLYFYYDKGLSPLHFIALGLRSAPRHSVIEGCKAGIIHDNSAFFQELKRSESSGSNNDSWPGYMLMNHLKDYSSIPCVLLRPGLEEKYEMMAKRELIVNCLEVLLRAGANPNVGQSVILKGAYPLDIILQPPTKLYYAPSAARGNQSSISLRLQDLDYCADQVVAACDSLLCRDAGVSLKFLSNYMWRPELLDCFHLKDDHTCQQQVVFLIRLGLFPDRFKADRKLDVGAELCSISVYTSAIIHRFIADVINTSTPIFLTVLILKWCSVTFLHDIVKTVAKIAEMSGWNDNLKQLNDVALSLQLRSLKHSCFYVILSGVKYSFSAIWSLPLPTRLKMELTYLYL